MTENDPADDTVPPVSVPTENQTPLGAVDVVLPGLTDRDRAILGFESERWRHNGAKDEAIRDAFDLTPARYYQVLGVLIDLPAALVADPMLIKRLQRMRAERAVARGRRSVPSAH